MMKDKKGFTLVELITVIVIIAILMMIGIPSISKYIDDSRKDAYIDTAINYTEAVRNNLNTQTTLLRTTNSQYLYLIPVSNQEEDTCVILESGGDSPFDDHWVYAYVGVTFEMGKGYKYYFLSQDGSDRGVFFKEINELKEKGADSIVTYVSLDDEDTNEDETIEPVDLVLKKYYEINGKVERDSDILEGIDKPLRLDESDLSSSPQIKRALALTNKKYVFIYSSYYCKYGINERQTKNILNKCDVGYQANEREVCEPIEYKITYRLNGGLANNLIEKYTINSSEIRLPQPVRRGYKFLGWTGTNGFVPQASLVIPAKSYGNKMYIANFEAINCKPWEDLNESDLCVEKTYSINYILNEGSMPSSPTTYKYSSSDILLPQPTKPSFNFVGWIGSNGVSPEKTVTIRHNSYGDKTYTAIYEEKKCEVGTFLNASGNCELVTYTISYNLNGGTLADQPLYFTKLSENIVIGQPTKTGYDFVGWVGSNGIEPELTVTIPNGSMGNKNYTAVFNAKTCPVGYIINNRYGCDLVNYKINYNLNDGTIINAPTSYTIESDTFSIPEPTKLHYEFVGWTGSNGVVPMTSVTIPSGSYGERNYTAIFRAKTCPVGKELNDNDECILKEYTISYNFDGGTTTDEYITTYTIETPNFNLPSHVTKAGVEFAGWTGSNGNSPRRLVTVPEGTYGNLSYVANYTSKDCETGYALNQATNSCERVNYTITYNLNGGTASGNPTSYNIDTNTFTLNMPTKAGYDFEGWIGSNGLVPQKTISIPKGSVGSKTYTAIFNELTCDPGYQLNSSDECELVEYTITYELNGGTATNPGTYYVTSDNIVLNNPVKKGYNFTGWTGSNGSTPAAGIAIMKGSTGNRSYVANYTQKTCQTGYSLNNDNECVMDTYTITLNLSGGTVSGSYPETYNVETDTIVLPTPTKNTYHFAGWTGSNGVIPQKVVQIDRGSSGNKTYTAVFTEAECGEGYDLDSNYNCIPHIYKIEYDLAGGYLASPIFMYSVETTTFALPKPARAGYVFLGWIGSNGVVAQEDVMITLGSTGDKNYTAVWTTKTCNNGYQLNNENNQCELTNYLITYYLQGGTLSGNYPTTYTISTPTFSLPTPTMDGYYFFGWTGSNGNDPDPNVVVTQGTTGNLSYYANFDTETYYITYNLNGGVYSGGNNPNPVEYTNTTNTFTLLNPSKNGYTFTGWTGANGNTPKQTVTITKGSFGNRIYTANYAPICESGYSPNASTGRCEPVTYRVSFNANGGIGGQTEDVYVKYNSSMPEITTIPPTRDGYQFTGWYDDAVNGTQYYNATGQSARYYDKTLNVLLFAHWLPSSYSITYHLNGGTVAGNPSSYTINTDTFSLTSPVKSGYTFQGWTGTGITGTQKSVTISKGSTGNREYSAIFVDANCSTGYAVGSSGNCEPMKYTISFNANGGSGGQTSNVVATYGNPMPDITSTAPVRAGYTFQGWYDTPEVGGVRYYDSNGESSVNYTRITGITLYARWMARTYTISFDANGGTGGQQSQVVAEYGHSMPTISTTPPQKNNYNFLGWYDSTANTGVRYYDSNGNGVRNFDKTSNTTLYAIFEQQKYTVSFNVNGGTGGQSVSVQALYGAPMPTISTTRPTKSGVQFTGWYDSCTITGTQYYKADGTSARDYDRKSNVTLYACWDKSQYVMSFDLNGGVGIVEPIIVIYNSSLPKLTSSYLPTKSGYTFAGWYDNPVDGTEYYDASGNPKRNYLFDHDATLYAHWEGRPYTCSPGQYLSGSLVTCSSCVAGYYCPGGTYYFNGTDRGLYECGYGNYCPAESSEQTTCPTNYNFTFTTTSSAESDCYILLFDCQIYCRDLTSPDGTLYVSSGNNIVYTRFAESVDYSETNPQQSSAYQKMNQVCNNSKAALCERWHYGEPVDYSFTISRSYYGEGSNLRLCVDNPAGCVVEY